MSEGRVVVHSLTSRVLADNPLGDPARRRLHVYLPPGYDAASTRPYPTLLALVGFAGTGGMLFNVDPFGEDLKARLDRLIRTRACPPCVVAVPDCFNRLGGSQYINSSAVGRYEDYLVREIVPFVRNIYRTGRWGVFGKSSGGYGSIVQAMRHPEIFQAVADHSGDSNFELSYLPDFPDALDRFRESGGPKQWLRKFWAAPNRHSRRHHKALNMLAMSAHYSPSPKSPHMGIDFPFDLKTGIFKPEVWKRWQAWDPVRMVERYASNLKKLRLIYLECGIKDEFGLHWGARALSAALKRRGIRHRHEEFDDGHMHVSYRYDVSLPLLVRALR